jgi:SAM-dependent methyltransferase
MTRELDSTRLREFWNSRYTRFTLSESGWAGAGEGLNDRLYACKDQALRRAIADTGLAAAGGWSVLDAGCGQGHFARFYRSAFPGASYVGLDISDRAVAFLQRAIPGAEFHVADLCEWRDPRDRTFDIVQSFEVLHLILDDDQLRRALANLSRLTATNGAMLVTAALPEETCERSGYLRYRSRAFWQHMIASIGLRVERERPMYYWLPAGGPSNKYMRYGLTRLGTGTLFALDRAAHALRLPQPASVGMDSRMKLLTLRHV